MILRRAESRRAGNVVHGKIDDFLRVFDPAADLKRFEHPLHLTEDVADQFSIAPKTVDNLLLTTMGMSFAKYQTHHKLEMIASLLEVEPDIRLSEVAELYGFCDEFHLSKAFKSKYGISPNQYKMKNNF